jgi:septal ring factor EnvC (AmiA/AmiB activator)
MIVSTAYAADPPVSPEQLRELENRIAILQADRENVRTEYGSLQRQLQVNEENTGEIAEQLEIFNETLADKRNVLADLQIRQKNQQVQLQAQRQVLAKQIRASYIMGRQDYMKMWLNQENPVAIGRVLSYYDYFNRARTEQINTITAILKQITELKQRVENETQQLNLLIVQETTKKKQYHLSHSERQAILSQLEKKLENQDEELKLLSGNKQKLETLLGTLHEVVREMPEVTVNFTENKGGLLLPVNGQVIKKFHDSLIGRLKWQGLLIEANKGDKVKSVSAGRVVFAQWFRHFGLLVIVDHGKGYMSLYAHNQSLYVKTGDWVEPNQVIASVGDSGGRRQSALYFEIRHQGIPIDPVTWLKNESQ